MNKYWRLLVLVMLYFVCFNVIAPPISHAAPVDNIIGALASTVSQNQESGHSGGAGLLENLFSLLFDHILGPIFHVTNTSAVSNVKVTPLPTEGSDIQDSGFLKGRVIVIDPGHGGSNPGAVANNNRESDNNLAVGLKLRDKLVNAGAKVIMTRDTDRTVAPEGDSLRDELQARVDIANNNAADIFVSLHSNENSDSSIAGTMTFYHSDRSAVLAQEVQKALIQQVQSVDKGTSTANFYVLRNTSMPSILVEMGFVSNPQEAALLGSDAYRDKLSQGIFNGIVNYFSK